MNDIGCCHFKQTEDGGVMRYLDKDKRREAKSRYGFDRKPVNATDANKQALCGTRVLGQVQNNSARQIIHIYPRLAIG